MFVKLLNQFFKGLIFSFYVVCAATADEGNKPLGSMGVFPQVAGITLGMDVESTISELKKFDSEYQIKKMYAVEGFSHAYDQRGDTEENLKWRSLK